MHDLEILYEDADIIVIYKPKGLATQSASFRTKDATDILRLHLREQAPQKEPYLGVIHRLDTPVDGKLVFAKNKQAAAALSTQMQNGAFTKIYEACVHGQMPAKEGSLDDYLLKEKKGNHSKVVAKGTPGAKHATLEYRLLTYDAKRDESHLEIHLGTGRHHQIRVQLANCGHPLVGDTKYGTDTPEELKLSATTLCFLHPRTKKQLRF